jgi:hypothetical protein
VSDLRMFGVLYIVVKYTIARVTSGIVGPELAPDAGRPSVAKTLDSRCVTIERPNAIMSVLFSFVNALQSVPQTLTVSV